MALVLIEGFDHFTTVAQAAAKGWSDANNAYGATGRINGLAALVGGVSGGVGDIRKSLPAGGGYSELYFGVAINLSTFGTGAGTFFFRVKTVGLGSDVLFLYVNPAGNLALYTPASVLIATGTQVMTTGAWQYIEFHVLVNGAASSVAAQVNGTPDIPPTTCNLGSSVMGGIQPWNANTVISQYYDDIYVCDTTGPNNKNFLGDVHVQTLMPDADGFYTQWTPLTGTAHYAMVDEIPPDGDTSYNYDSTVGDKDTYEFPSLAILAGSVYGIQVNLWARKDDAALRQIGALLHFPGPNDFTGSTNTLTTSYQDFTYIWNQNPNTSANWNISDINTIQAGVVTVT